MTDSITIDSVFLNFGTTEVLRGVYLEFKPNQTTGLLGRNGSGKSCLLQIITGQLYAQNRHIRYRDQPLRNLYQKKGLINYLPQHRCHPTALSIKQLLRYYNIPTTAFVAHYPFAQELLSTKLGQLSGGEQRLLETLLVLEAPTLFTILDEPFSHIAPRQIDLVKQRINTLKTQKGILLTNHQYQHILDLSDALYLLKDGTTVPVVNEMDLRRYGYIR